MEEAQIDECFAELAGTFAGEKKFTLFDPVIAFALVARDEFDAGLGVIVGGGLANFGDFGSEGAGFVVFSLKSEDEGDAELAGFILGAGIEDAAESFEGEVVIFLGEIDFRHIEVAGVRVGIFFDERAEFFESGGVFFLAVEKCALEVDGGWLTGPEGLGFGHEFPSVDVIFAFESRGGVPDFDLVLATNFGIGTRF